MSKFLDCVKLYREGITSRTEIGERLSITKSAVSQHLHQARLRGILDLSKQPVVNQETMSDGEGYLRFLTPKTLKSYETWRARNGN